MYCILFIENILRYLVIELFLIQYLCDRIQGKMDLNNIAV
jgi:hypothetical protein